MLYLVYYWFGTGFSRAASGNLGLEYQEPMHNM